MKRIFLIAALLVALFLCPHENARATVLSSRPVNGSYEVTVELADGNRYSYYDTDYQPIKSEMYITLQDGRVVNAVPANR